MLMNRRLAVIRKYGLVDLFLKEAFIICGDKFISFLTWHMSFIVFSCNSGCLGSASSLLSKEG